MPAARKRRLLPAGDKAETDPATRAQTQRDNGIGESLEDDVPLTAAEQRAPTPRKKLRKVQDPASDGAKPQRRDGRAPRAAAAGRTPAAGVKERLEANQERFRSQLKTQRAKHIEEYFESGGTDDDAGGAGREPITISGSSSSRTEDEDQSGAHAGLEDSDSEAEDPAAGRGPAAGAGPSSAAAGAEDDDEDESLEGFIVKDAEEEADGGGAEGEEGGPDEAEREAELQRLLKAIKHKLTRDGADPDRPLADEFPSYIAAMVYRYLGLKMPGWLAKQGWSAKLRMQRVIGSTKDSIQGNLGWINAADNGIMKAMRRLPLLTTDWNFNEEALQSGSFNDMDEEARDGAFDCQVCGRKSSVRAAWLKGRPYDADKLGRPQWADQEEGEKFVMGGECVQRVMAAHMLEHWEWALVTKLTAEVKRIYLRMPADAGDRAHLAAVRSLEQVRLINDLFGMTNRAVGLGRKLHTSPTKHGANRRYSGIAKGIGKEVLDIVSKMNPAQRTLNFFHGS